jgi:hypothetical protein
MMSMTKQEKIPFGATSVVSLFGIISRTTGLRGANMANLSDEQPVFIDQLVRTAGEGAPVAGAGKQSPKDDPSVLLSHGLRPWA